jgi:hypothetical protein
MIGMIDEIDGITMTGVTKANSKNEYPSYSKLIIYLKSQRYKIADPQIS